MCFEESPWSLQEAWRRICHEHDEVVRFCCDVQGLEDDVWLSCRWKPPPPGTLNLCVDGSFLHDQRCMGYGG